MIADDSPPTTAPEVERSGILLVDDDETLLASMRRLLRPDGLRLLTAPSGEGALAVLEEQAPTLGAVISDYAMPGMSGADLLRAVRLRWPDLTRVMATGNADLAAAARAVNEGQISRLVTKPWDPDEFRALVMQALDQHSFVVENRRLRALAEEQNARLEHQAARLEQWNQRLEEMVAERTAELQAANASLQRGLFDTVRLLLGFLERRLPERAARSREVARLAGKLAERLGVGPEEARRVQIAALVHDIGLLGVSRSVVLVPPHELPPAGRILYERHPLIGQSMLDGVAQLAEMGTWIRHHHERWDGRGYPDRLSGTTIPLASRIIALADGYLDAVQQKPERSSAYGVTAWSRSQADAGAFDPDLLGKLVAEVGGAWSDDDDTGIAIVQLRPGMRLEEPVKTTAGAVLVKAGELLTAGLVARLRGLAASGVLAAERLMVAPTETGEDNQ